MPRASSFVYPSSVFVNPSFVNAATYNSSGSVSGTTGFTPNLPASIVAGNLLIAFITIGAGRTLTASAGWTIGGQLTTRVGWAWRIATGSDSGCHFTWTPIGAVAVTGCTVQYTGNSATPIGDKKDANKTGPNALTSITTTQTFSTAVVIWATNSASSNATFATSTMSERAGNHGAGTASSEVDDATVNAIGSFGSSVGSIGGATVWEGWLIEIKSH